MLAQIDFTGLPAPAAIEPLNFETVLADLVDALKVELPEWNADVESDPAAKILEVCAYRELILRARINDAAKALMTAYGVQADLDHLAANVGLTRLTGETDDRLRERVRAGFYLASAAGPGGTYKLHAQSVSAQITNVEVITDSPGSVKVTVLAYEIVAEGDATEDEIRQGAAAFPDVTPEHPELDEVVPARSSGPLIDAVREALSAEDVVPLTDAVQVRVPTITEYALDAELTLYPGPDAATVKLASETALAAYLAENTKIGYDHTLAGLIDALVVAGVQNVEITAPTADLVMASGELALCTSIAAEVADVRAV